MTTDRIAASQFATEPGLTIDLNADLGESYGNWRMGDDEAMLDIVTSANIACGFHAGDPLTIRRTVQLAFARDVVIGAHVSFHDIIGFGRRAFDIEPEALAADVLYQLAALDGICRSEGGRVCYVKAHGALYHRMNTDPAHAQAVVEGVRAFDESLPFLGSPTTMPSVAAGSGRQPPPAVGECFADRAYLPDGTSLVPRTSEGAVLQATADVAAQALRLARSGRFESVCLHGDTPGAVGHARAVRAALEHDGFAIRPFVRSPS